MGYNQQKKGLNQEYQFSETEAPESSNAESAIAEEEVSKVGFLDKIKQDPRLKKMVFIGIGVVGLLVAFKGISALTSKKSSSLKEEVMKTQEIIKQIEPAVAPIQQRFAFTPAKETVASSEKEEALKIGVEELKKNNEDLERDLAKIASFTIELQQQMEEISGQISLLRGELTKATEMKKVYTQQKKKLLPRYIRKSYTVRAIIQGRAWLVSADGESLDVKVGDILPGYGEVQVISVKKGVVLTKDGSVIRLGRYDS